MVNLNWNEVVNIAGISSLTGIEMQTTDFFTQTKDDKYDPITDLVIQLNDVIIIFEVKPNDSDCIAQLYNQSLNAMGNDVNVLQKNVTPVDLNWKKLIEICIKVVNFQKINGNKCRVSEDFLEILNTHNFRWLPIFPMSQLVFKNNRDVLNLRLAKGINEAVNESLVSNERQGFTIRKPWAEEVLFGFSSSEDVQAKMWAAIWPGNTKGQGYHIFKSEGEPNFKTEITVFGKKYLVSKNYHLKFSHFQKYICSLDFTSEVMTKQILTQHNFHHISGRKQRNQDDWKLLQEFFDSHFNSDAFDWRIACDWNSNLIKSNRTYFDLAFGYELNVYIPWGDIQTIDKSLEDVKPFSSFLDEIANQMQDILL